MNSKNSKTSDSHTFILNLSDKTNVKRSDKYLALWSLSICYTSKIMKISNKNNKFKVSALTWKDKFKLPDGSYSVSDIQDRFELFVKEHEKLTGNPPIRIHVIKIENSIAFKIKSDIILNFSNRNDEIASKH